MRRRPAEAEETGRRTSAAQPDEMYTPDAQPHAPGASRTSHEPLISLCFRAISSLRTTTYPGRKFQILAELLNVFLKRVADRFQPFFLMFAKNKNKLNTDGCVGLFQKAPREIVVRRVPSQERGHRQV